ncbi:M90 protein [Murid betaherpesvirus 1]|nr:M90 protein [Murid betaherpesvirus 1]
MDSARRNTSSRVSCSMPAFLSSPRITFMLLGVLLCFALASGGTADLYTWIQATPSNITSPSDVFTMNVTISATDSDRSGRINASTFAYVTEAEQSQNEADAPEYDTASKQIYTTFAPVLFNWFRVTDKNNTARFRTVLFILTCNETHSSLLMNSPPRFTAMRIDLDNTNATQPLYLQMFSKRQCMKKIEPIITKRSHVGIRRILSKTCLTYRRAADPEVQLAEGTVGREPQEAYTFLHVLVAFLFCIGTGLIVCLYAILRPYYQKKSANAFPKKKKNRDDKATLWPHKPIFTEEYYDSPPGSIKKPYAVVNPGFMYKD